jgi:hypothetical protein
MSFLKSKHSGWSADGTRTPYMGGGGGGGQPAPTQSTSYSTNLPEYAKPYVETMLGATQQQLFDMDGSGITGFKPYTPYSTDVNQYVAGFSPLQQQAQRATAGLQTPDQYGAATGLAAVSGMGALGAGRQYAQNVTDPSMMQAYMSPYQQGVTDIAKNAAVREAQIAQNTQNLGASRQGTYGGARQALMQGERERNLLSNLSNIQAQGSQSAFDRAMQAQQFGSTLGMQGYGQAGQAASTLGQLGGQQLGAQKEIIGLQSQMGAQQQAQEQSKINQAIQDYAIQQQYPLMQLGFMSNMLRGLPMQSQTTQLYQAQPSTLQQGIGLAGAAGTLFGGGRAEGGAIKMAEGGITGYKYGGAIAEPKLESMADSLSVAQLQQRIKDPALTPGERDVFKEALAAKQQTAARSSGIAAAGGGLFNTMGYAGGGILAFAGDDESFVRDPQFGGGPSLDEDQARLDQIQLQKDMQQYEFLKDASPVAAQRMLDKNPMLRDKVAPASAPAPAPKPEAKPPTVKPAGAPPTGPSAGPTTGIRSLEDQLKEQERLMGPNTAGQGLEAKIAERLAGMDKLKDRDELAAMRRAFVEFGTKPALGGILQAATGAVGTYGEASDAARKVREGMDLELTKMQADIKKGERAEKRGNLDAASKSYENAENRQLKIAEMQNQLKVAGIQASRSSEFERQYEAFKANPKQFEQFKKSLTSQDDTARLNAYVKADEFITKAYPNLIFSKKPEDKIKLDEIRNSKVAEYLGAISQTPQGAPAGGGAKGQVDTKNPLLGP